MGGQITSSLSSYDDCTPFSRIFCNLAAICLEKCRWKVISFMSESIFQFARSLVQLKSDSIARV